MLLLTIDSKAHHPHETPKKKQKQNLGLDLRTRQKKEKVFLKEGVNAAVMTCFITIKKWTIALV